MHQKGGVPNHEGNAPTARRAKVFWTGRSQAVRLPKAFRFTTDEVLARRDGERIILEPIHIERDVRGWPRSWWALAGAAPDFDVGQRPSKHERGDDVLSRPLPSP